MRLCDMPAAARSSNKVWFVSDVILGVLGLAMPLIVWIGGGLLFDVELQPSLSDYYHTPIGPIHVGALLAFAVYFIIRPWPSAKGRIAGMLIGVFTAGAALIPVAPCRMIGDAVVREPDLASLLHLIAAFLLLATFAYLMFFRFGRNGAGSGSGQLIHQSLGVIMVMCSFAIVGFGLFGETCHTAYSRNSEVFWLEGAGLSAFWISWLIDCLGRRRSG